MEWGTQGSGKQNPTGCIDFLGRVDHFDGSWF